LSDEVKAVEGTDVTVGALKHFQPKTYEEVVTVKAGPRRDIHGGGEREDAVGIGRVAKCGEEDAVRTANWTGAEW
jgi:hypothetical protein